MYFRIRDNSSIQWGHLALDNLRYHGTPFEDDGVAHVAPDEGGAAPFRPLRFGVLVGSAVLVLVLINHCIARQHEGKAGEQGGEADRLRREVERRIREQQQVCRGRSQRRAGALWLVRFASHASVGADAYAVHSVREGCACLRSAHVCTTCAK